MREPRFTPGQEVTGKLACYRLLVDADKCGYAVQYRAYRAVDGGQYTWHDCNIAGHAVDCETVLRRTPEPPKKSPCVALLWRFDTKEEAAAFRKQLERFVGTCEMDNIFIGENDD